MSNAPIIIKKVSGHGGHHGGAWKVAYADFVTAMMALFIVLWLLNSSKQVQEAVGGYFKDPTGNSKMVGSNMRGAGQNLDLRKDDMKKIKEALETQIKSLPDFEKPKVFGSNLRRVTRAHSLNRAARCQVQQERNC
jgi:chemotaxis protein MotB